MSELEWTFRSCSLRRRRTFALENFHFAGETFSISERLDGGRR